MSTLFIHGLWGGQSGSSHQHFHIWDHGKKEGGGSWRWQSPAPYFRHEDPQARRDSVAGPESHSWSDTGPPSPSALSIAPQSPRLGSALLSHVLGRGSGMRCLAELALWQDDKWLPSIARKWFWEQGQPTEPFIHLLVSNSVSRGGRGRAGGWKGYGLSNSLLAETVVRGDQFFQCGACLS